MKKQLIILCAGGFAREVLQWATDAFSGRDDIETGEPRDLFDDQPFHPGPNEVFSIASGDPAVREKLAAKVTEAGGAFQSIVHPLAYVAPSATIGEGSILCPFSFAGPYAVIGRQVVVNVHASCGHESQIGDYSVLSPYAFVAGRATLGESSFLGSMAFVAQTLTIGRRSKISAGAVTHRDVEAGSLVVGNPAAARRLFPA